MSAEQTVPVEVERELVGDTIISTDPFAAAALPGASRATTTERRTTTTTTTKRTVKSSDDFMPLATDVQQVRSESRTGSISSSSPLFGASATLPSQAAATSSETSTSTQTTTTTSSAQQQQQQAARQLAGQTSSTHTSSSSTTQQTSGLQSPVVQDTEDGRVLKLRFDVTQYEPDEIVVKTVDNRLTVHAKHEERSENRSVYREYNREFHLPDGTDVEQIRSSLSKEGILTVECPLPTPQLRGASRKIPIERV